jgi:exoribonuclease R
VLSGLPRDAGDDSGPALALRRAASSLLRGAGYAAFDQAAGTAPPADPGHGGIGAPYAHVTAPLRRLVDRFSTEVCLAVAAGAALPEWLTAALPTLPSVMAESDAVAAKVERACVDRTEAALLASRVGAEFAAVVLRASGPENEPGEVFVAEPPVLAKGTGVPRAGEVVRVELVEADPTTGRITFRAE